MQEKLFYAKQKKGENTLNINLSDSIGRFGAKEQVAVVNTTVLINWKC